MKTFEFIPYFKRVPDSTALSLKSIDNSGHVLFLVEGELLKEQKESQP